MDERISHFRQVRKAWRQLHGTKAGSKRQGLVGKSEDGKPIYGPVTVPLRFAFAFEGTSKPRRPSRRRTALWACS